MKAYIDIPVDSMRRYPLSLASVFQPYYLPVFLLLAVMVGVLPFSAVHAEDSAVGLLKQMIAIAADNGGVGRTGELNALKQQIAALPKLAHGDRPAAQEANKKGLAEFNAKQYGSANQYFIAAQQADPADAEIAGNLGFTYLKLGDLKQAVKALSTALVLAPGRSSTWANLAEYYALQGQQQEAVACYALAFQFSQNQNKSREYLQKQVTSADDPKVRQAAQQALQLSLIQGSGGTVAAPTEDSLDAPLPAASASKSLAAAPPPVAAPAPPAVAAPPAAAPVTPPPAPATSVATPLIPPSLLPAANPKADAGVAPPAPGNDAVTAGTGNDDIVEVVAQGMGTDQPSALNNAYSNAVQQALGLYVDAETMVQNDQIVRDQILTYSKGFIQKADIVSQSQANGLFQVNIRAKIKRQKLLEQAKASNISVKAVEGVSLHAQVESQIKQEKDAKALLEKTLLPLMDATLLRAELVPSTQEQPNPTINKKDTDEKFVTLDYRVYLWIDEPEYYKYVKNSLIPVLNQIAIREGELTAMYNCLTASSIKEDSHCIHKGQALEDNVLNNLENEEDKTFLFSVLTWKDKGLSSSKWQWFAVSKDTVPPLFLKRSFENRIINKTLSEKAIELSLLNEKSEMVALGNAVVRLSDNSYSSNSPMVLNDYPNPRIRISPYFTFEWGGYGRFINSPKSVYFTISVKVSKEDLPRVKSAKLEVKSAGE